MEKQKSEVYIERASPLTINGVASMSCSDEEYKWFMKGFEDGMKQCQQRWVEKFKKYACIKNDQWYKDWLLELENTEVKCI